MAQANSSPILADGTVQLHAPQPSPALGGQDRRSRPKDTDAEELSPAASSERVAVLGCGYWGKNIVRTLAELGALEAIVDTDPQIAANLSHSFGVRSATFESALFDPKVTAVAIAAPAKLHFKLAMKALAAGKHVFVEKPIALEVTEAERLMQAARAASRVLMVGHLLHYHPGYQALREIVRSGQLGRLHYIYSNRLSLGKFRNDEDVLWSFAPHDVSMVLDLAGEEPEGVVATGVPLLRPRISDTCHLHLTFPSGLRAHIFVSWFHPFKEQRLTVVGERGAVVFDDVAPLDRKLIYFPYSIERQGEAPAPCARGSVPIAVRAGEPLKAEMQHFLECCRTGTTPHTDSAEGLRVLSVLKRGSAAGEARCEAKAAKVYVDSTAIVDPDVQIGPGSKIWHFSHILSHTRIGRDVIIGQNVMIGPKVNIGNRVKIQNNVSIYTGVTLEDGVFCGPSCVFTNVLDPRAELERKHEFRETLVKRGATIGANATIVCGHTVGRYALVAAGAVVTKDVPDFALVAGVPAKRIGWVSRSGRRLGPDLVCPETGERYRMTARGGLEEVV